MIKFDRRQAESDELERWLQKGSGNVNLKFSFHEHRVNIGWRGNIRLPEKLVGRAKFDRGGLADEGLSAELARTNLRRLHSASSRRSISRSSGAVSERCRGPRRVRGWSTPRAPTRGISMPMFMPVLAALDVGACIASNNHHFRVQGTVLRRVSKSAKRTGINRTHPEHETRFCCAVLEKCNSNFV